MFFRNLLVILFIGFFSVKGLGQTTTSSMSGTIKSYDGTPLPGATITATHEPTGTVYRAQSLTGGRFDINYMSAGGPYSVEVSFVNFASEITKDLYLSLGEVFKLNVSSGKAKLVISFVGHEQLEITVNNRQHR